MQAPAQHDEYVTTLAKSVVSDMAPAELPLFDQIAETYQAKQRQQRSFWGQLTRWLGYRDTQEDPLGFGLQEAAELLTPAVITIATIALTKLYEKFAEHLVQDAATYLGKVMERLRRGPEEPPDDMPEFALPAGEIEIVRTAIIEEAIRIKVAPTDEQAVKIVDVIMNKLGPIDTPRGTGHDNT